MLIPIVYYLLLTAWLPRTLLERVQFLVGLAGFVVFGPVINISVMFYAVWNMDSFGWGKTRRVMEDDDKKVSDGGSATEEEGATAKGATQEESAQRGCTCGF
jgi:chitin synthase